MLHRDMLANLSDPVSARCATWGAAAGGLFAAVATPAASTAIQTIIGVVTAIMVPVLIAAANTAVKTYFDRRDVLTAWDAARAQATDDALKALQRELAELSRRFPQPPPIGPPAPDPTP